ncbi:unnamed protein product [Microthlaspi erraticum]|uniref:DUF3511 domain-containing protein n=1 Tax=Microthlaspi erraticum TaxID=1685480 RepID=A0A6D2IN31_9BRAS|nr:unnamed protein product [Microthlaspi erraticum]
MDGFGSNQRTLAVDQWIEIVNGKGYGARGATQTHSTRYGSSDFQPSIPPPPGAATTNAQWRFMDSESKRKKRIATYKAYEIEGKVKSTVKKGFRWMKNTCSQIIHG